LRRGTDTDRKLTTLCEGELGYSIDAFRVVVGDGTTLGGLSLGATVFVSAGSLASNFHTNLTTASANGLALSGDFAVFPAATYKKADGDTDSVPSASATNVMLLTGADASAGDSWVAVNSGIPYGNIDVQDNDISGNYISGGIITAPIEITGGDITLSGGPVNIGGDGLTETIILSGIALSAENATAFSSTKIYPLGITGSAQLTAISGVGSFTNVIPDIAGGKNYYWDHFGFGGGVAPADNTSVVDALTKAVEVFNSSTGEGDMLYIRFGFVRSWSRGNGGRSSSVTAVVGFLKKAAHYPTADPAVPDVIGNWVQISSVFHGRGNTQTALRGTTTTARFPAS
jgi:hypothetical protein